MKALAQEQNLDAIFHALADSTRRKIMKMISKRAMTVSDIAKNFEISLNGISKHLKVLEKAQLLSRNKEGRIHYCQVNPKPLADAANFINFYEAFWNSNLDNLANFLEQGDENE